MKKYVVPYLLMVPQLILSALFLVGLFTGITQSFGVIPAFGLREPTTFYYEEVLSKPEMVRSILYSLRVAFFSSAGAVVFGVFFCSLCVMYGRTGKIFMSIVQIPVIVPHVVTAIFMVNIFSQNGILARIAYWLGMIGQQQDFPMLLYDAKGIGVVLAYLWKEIPFILYFVIAMMSHINDRLGEAAVNLGAGRWSAFFRVTLPLCSHTIISGFLILFVFALGAYELPFLLGATLPKALPVLAYQQYTHPDLKNRPYAMALNGIIILISLLCALAYYLLLKKQTEQGTIREAGKKDRREGKME